VKSKLILPYSSAQTLKDYIALPSQDREYRGFYMFPYALPYGEWDKISLFFKKEYPVQYFFRETIIGNTQIFFARTGYRFRDFRHSIRDYFFPRRPELRAAIPRGYSDLGDIVEGVLVAVVKSYVEKELKSNIEDMTFDGTESDEAKKAYIRHNTFNAELRDCYDYVAGLRPNLIEGKGKEESHPKREEIENKIKELDDKWLVWVVLNRNKLWT